MYDNEPSIWLQFPPYSRITTFTCTELCIDSKFIEIGPTTTLAQPYNLCYCHYFHCTPFLCLILCPEILFSKSQFSHAYTCLSNNSLVSGWITTKFVNVLLVCTWHVRDDVSSKQEDKFHYWSHMMGSLRLGLNYFITIANHYSKFHQANI